MQRVLLQSWVESYEDSVFHRQYRWLSSTPPMDPVTANIHEPGILERMIENLGKYGELSVVMKAAGGPEKFLQHMARNNQIKGFGAGIAGTGLLALAGLYFYESHKQRQLATEAAEERKVGATAEPTDEMADSQVGVEGDISEDN